MGLEDLVQFLSRRWKAISLGFCVGICAAALYFIFGVPVYRSEATVSFVPAGGGAMSNISGRLGGLASLAGIQTSDQQEQNEAVAFLKSGYLIGRFIESENLLPKLFPKKWDDAKGTWKEGTRIPTMGDGIRKIRESIYSVSQDRKTGLLAVSIDCGDREACATWLRKLIALANEEMRQRAITDSSQRLAYLNAELAKTEVREEREMLFRLQESQYRIQTYARASPEFAYRVLDPPRAPDEHERLRPRLGITAVGGVMLGLVLAAIFALLMEGAAMLATLRRTKGRASGA